MQQIIYFCVYALCLCLKTITMCLMIDFYYKGRWTMNPTEEARYHYVLSDMADLVDEYGYANVINDLDEMIQAKANQLLYEVTNV